MFAGGIPLPKGSEDELSWFVVVISAGKEKKELSKVFRHQQ
jgi:hypothetical protein